LVSLFFLSLKIFSTFPLMNQFASYFSINQIERSNKLFYYFQCIFIYNSSCLFVS
jgi:hypothetical protein